MVSDSLDSPVGNCISLENTWLVSNKPSISNLGIKTVSVSRYFSEDHEPLDMEVVLDSYVKRSESGVQHALIFCDSLSADDAYEGHVAWLADVDRHTTQIFCTLQVAVKKLAAEKGQKSITLVSDIFGIGGVSSSKAASAYSGALIGMIKSLAKEMSRYDLSINLIAVGALPEVGIDSRLNSAQEKLVKMTKLGSQVSPRALLSAISFLQSSGMSVTGQVICLDGGLLI